MTPRIEYDESAAPTSKTRRVVRDDQNPALSIAILNAAAAVTVATVNANPGMPPEETVKAGEKFYALWKRLASGGAE